MPYIDIHTHEATPREGVLKVCSVEAGVVGLSELRPEQTSGDSRVLYSVGVYPFAAKSEDVDRRFEQLESMAERHDVWAIGETGLDRRPQYRDSIDWQARLFQLHVELANRVGKPLVIHQVRALDQTLEVLESARVPVVFHGFSGSEESAALILGRSARYYLSFGHMIAESEKIAAALRGVPVDRLMLETDASGLDIETIYQMAAGIRGQQIEELKTLIDKNFRTINERVAGENTTFGRR